MAILLLNSSFSSFRAECPERRAYLLLVLFLLLVLWVGLLEVLPP